MDQNDEKRKRKRKWPFAQQQLTHHPRQQEPISNHNQPRNKSSHNTPNHTTTSTTTERKLPPQHPTNQAIPTTKPTNNTPGDKEEALTSTVTTKHNPHSNWIMKPQQKTHMSKQQRTKKNHPRREI